MASTASEVRYAELEYETPFARVQVVLDLDGGTRRDIATGIGVLDHMLKQAAFFANFDLGIGAEGNLHVDDHHTVEAIGAALGKAFQSALSESGPTDRLGSAHGVCDEALALVAVDVTGHRLLTFDCAFTRERLGLLSTESIREFFRAFATHSGVTLHIHRITSENDHHLCEAIFKGFGLSLARAVKRNEGHRTPKGARGRID